ncbi:RNA pseudouridine synthase [candidate division KSB1 bacterium]|nr:RNA pseudouridine synthase [candidate division KSB1 bacterium]
MLSQADHTGDADALTLAKNYLKEKYDKPGEVFLGLVHRLDRPASGVMVFARTSKAARRLFVQFKERTVEKYYMAIVHGKCPMQGSCEDFLLKKDLKVTIVDKNVKGAQFARLDYRLLGYQNGYSLLEIKLATGRPHQIRVQLSAIGHPLVGDLRYGSQQPFDGKNLALHCFRLTVSHPTQNTRVTQTAPPAVLWNSYFNMNNFF